MRRIAMHRGFTLIELLVVIAIIALLIGILLPTLGQARLSAQKLKNNVQLRSMHQGLVMHSEQNKEWYTGYDAQQNRWMSRGRGYDLISAVGHAGQFADMGTFPIVRFSEMLRLELVTPEDLIHPAEPDPKEIYDFPLIEEPTDGFTYEREAILEWLRSGNTTSPLSGAVLERNDLVPNHGAHSPCHHSILRVLALRSTLVEPRSCHSLLRTHHPRLPRSAAGCHPAVC